MLGVSLGAGAIHRSATPPHFGDISGERVQISGLAVWAPSKKV